MRSSGLLFAALIVATLPFRPVFTQETRPNLSEGDEDLRVGLISYDDPSTKVKEYQALFAELRKDSTVSIRYNPRFAVGTYADVLD
jgi:ABC-type phosphate/phosphonate transport system substrate-binding protein